MSDGKRDRVLVHTDDGMPLLGQMHSAHKSAGKIADRRGIVSSTQAIMIDCMNAQAERRITRVLGGDKQIQKLFITALWQIDLFCIGRLQVHEIAFHLGKPPDDVRLAGDGA